MREASSERRALGFVLECGEASPLWDFLFRFCLRGVVLENPKGKSESGDASPHSKTNPKTALVIRRTSAAGTPSDAPRGSGAVRATAPASSSRRTAMGASRLDGCAAARPAA